MSHHKNKQFDPRRTAGMQILKFWSYTDIGNAHECWNFKCAKGRGAVGKYHAMCFPNGLTVWAHRVSLALKLNRPIKEGMVSMHLCDNPSCVNPLHLKEGTTKENIQDAAPKSYKLFRRPLTKKQVAEVKRLYLTGRWSVSGLAEQFKVHWGWIVRFTKHIKLDNK